MNRAINPSVSPLQSTVTEMPPPPQQQQHQQQ